MPDFTGVLFVPAVLAASGLYVVASCWWRRRLRRRGVGPSDVFPGFRPAQPVRPRSEVAAQMLREQAAKLADAVGEFKLSA